MIGVDVPKRLVIGSRDKVNELGVMKYSFQAAECF